MLELIVAPRAPRAIFRSNVREIERLNQAELENGSSSSWHDQYKDSAYIYIGRVGAALLLRR